MLLSSVHYAELLHSTSRIEIFSVASLVVKLVQVQAIIK